MRTHGTLSKWNDEKGFGFVTLPSCGGELFVHVSAFPRDGVRPQVGEILSFDVQDQPDGSKRATNVSRPGKSRPAGAVGKSARRSRGRLSPALAVLAIAAMGAYGYDTYLSGRQSQVTMSPSPAAKTPAQAPAASGQVFKCDGRTQCSQMASCAEATYFIRHCPDTQMDGNNDGEPCEQQWCN